MYATTLTSKGQLTIPKPIRELLNWLQGEKLNIDIDLNAKEVKIKIPEKKLDIMDFYGAVKSPIKKYRHMSVEDIAKTAVQETAVNRYLKTLPADEKPN